MKITCLFFCSMMLILLTACTNQSERQCRSVDCRPLSTTKSLTIWWSPALQSENADFSTIKIYQ